VLVLDQLERSFGGVVALDGLDLRVAPGELCGFVGPNGAGKTTAMRCAVGVTTPDAGRVSWNGGAIDLERRRRIGYMPEERGLYPRMPVHEQLAYLAQLHGLSSADAVANATAWIDRLGLSERAGSAVEELSLGNQQRVQLAAALVHDPELLLLDEPFSGLDPIAVDVMGEVLLERARAGVAVVFSSHQLDLVEDLCQTVAVVTAGRIVLRGDVRTLQRTGDRRLRVEVASDATWWTSLPPGAEVVGRRNGEVTVALGDGVDPGDIIMAARTAGALLHVRLEEPRLSELFRDAVDEETRS
jgi:ABC-2 type transport system ATP-binding protein